MIDNQVARPLQNDLFDFAPFQGLRPTPSGGFPESPIFASRSIPPLAGSPFLNLNKTEYFSKAPLRVIGLSITLS